MILIGQFDSPYVRRVGIALSIYGLKFEHRPWSTFGDAERIRAFSPLLRVPVLVLDDGDVLLESHAMLDYLDSLVPAERRMFPAAEPDRHRALKVAALATGFADKAVSLFYERRLHDKPSPAIEQRWRAQIDGALGALEADRKARPGPFWFGPRIGHADVAVACAWRHASEAHYGLIDPTAWPAVAAHSAAMESLDVFRKVQQAFVAPA